MFVIGKLFLVGWIAGCLTGTLAGNVGPAILLGGWLGMWLVVRIYGYMAGKTA